LDIEISARICSRRKPENSQAVSEIGVGSVVKGLAKSATDRTDIFGCGRPIGTRFYLIPKSIEIASCCMVVH
jgi:hypothetical protein